MASMSSPSVPIFWLYHAFIDDVDYDWQHLPPKPKGLPPMAAAEPGGTSERSSAGSNSP